MSHPYLKKLSSSIEEIIINYRIDNDFKGPIRLSARCASCGESALWHGSNACSGFVPMKVRKYEQPK